MNSARKRIADILDHNTFDELWSDLHTYNFLDFTGYDEKIEKAKEKSGENESVIAGRGKINGNDCVVAFFVPEFMIGTMGLVAGEKISRAFLLASKKSLPVITFSISGGARMQESVVALTQMAKTVSAVYEHSQKRLLYISVVCDPTLGGVTASFASLADIIIGESGARFGFTGKGIIEETTREHLPDDFQTVEYAQKCGMVDVVVETDNMREVLGKLLALHPNRKRVWCR
ncbi:MAG: acetyl-CoA carboxylase carboxyl transferase subunit beta [Lachnospiraceae bacterium]|jgi:acetyl-CoA carboxylase carboxyl transferase subunit beta|nr:acetyl-CoA carboxylase carboxyl transferase subunit beta [Lachnospiraceae bacterium]